MFFHVSEPFRFSSLALCCVLESFLRALFQVTNPLLSVTSRVPWFPRFLALLSPCRQCRQSTWLFGALDFCHRCCNQIVGLSPKNWPALQVGLGLLRGDCPDEDGSFALDKCRCREGETRLGMGVSLRAPLPPQDMLRPHYISPALRKSHMCFLVLIFPSLQGQRINCYNPRIQNKTTNMHLNSQSQASVPESQVSLLLWGTRTMDCPQEHMTSSGKAEGRMLRRPEFSLGVLRGHHTCHTACVSWGRT